MYLHVNYDLPPGAATPLHAAGSMIGLSTMKTLLIVLTVTLAASTAWADDTVTHREETEHLLIVWNEGDATDEDVAATKRDGERYYAEIREMLGHEPDFKVTILLLGPAQRPDGSWGYPHVDSWGRVHLYQFGPTYHSYLSALEHEMVHVFRIERAPHGDWFLEEAFAEFVALRINESLSGFPWYGYPVTVVAGQWVENDEDIPLIELRERHRELNLPCKAQSYALRASFFDYLGRTYGDDKVIAMASEKVSGSLEDYEKYFGKDFDTLTKEWRAALKAEFEAFDGAAEQARKYRSESPIMYQKVCEAGKDF